MRIQLFSVSLLLALACSQADTPRVRARPTTPPPASVSASQTPVTNIAEGTTGDLGLSSSPDCPTDTLTVHDDPDRLVSEYVHRDATDSLAIANWNWGALACIERASSDLYSVVRSFKISTLSRSPDTAQFLVRYEQLFLLGWDKTGREPHLERSVTTVRDTIVVVRSRKGWRVVEFDAAAHRDLSTALRTIGTSSALTHDLLKAEIKPPGT